MTSCHDFSAAATTFRATSALLPKTPLKPSLSFWADPRFTHSIVDGTSRSSSTSTTGRWVGRLFVPRAFVPARREFCDVQRMTQLLGRGRQSAVQGGGQQSRRADWTPGRCRAGGGLLGGKGPTGRCSSWAS